MNGAIETGHALEKFNSMPSRQAYKGTGIFDKEYFYYNYVSYNFEDYELNYILRKHL